MKKYAQLNYQSEGSRTSFKVYLDGLLIGCVESDFEKENFHIFIQYVVDAKKSEGYDGIEMYIDSKFHSILNFKE